METAKEKLFKTMDRIEQIKSNPFRSEKEDLELEHLEVIKMQQWSDWKDPND